jgi:predicted unusual protein kinase regulating ubiquinone biosynthesis (AarF/ABC1/UbiB family)
MPAGIDFRRYRKVRRFVTWVFVQVVWWDVVLSVPGLRRFRRPPLVRYQGIARRYRALAAEMGGVLIKLGQFLSTRVDILPPEITSELAGLQDEVPPEQFADIVRQIEADFGRPAAAVFAWIGPEPVGAASLAQVHPARLPTGEEVVVKVLRPGIDVLVETDLAAVRLATRLLRFSKTIRRRVDLGRLGAEITNTTLAELDLIAEGHNAERFAASFANDSRVYLPKVFWDWSARRTLTLENVGWIKIADLAALDRAGIRRSEVARVLYRIYLQQIFEHSFVHADPHPGNLFVRPLPVEGEAPFPPGAPVPPTPTGEERPFQIVFVDFGMVAAIPDRLRGALREYAIALGTRDAERIVRSYVSAGVLLPGADLRRLEEIHEELFQRFWGVRLGDLRATAFSEAEYFFRQYRDVLYELPFQMQVDLLFASRAVGLLAGLSTQLDPEFDPWAETLPFAQRLAAQELRRNWREILSGGLAQLQILLGLPRRADAVLARAERGTLTIQSALTPEERKMIRRLERSIHRLSWTMLSAGLLIAGVMLRASAPGAPWGWVLIGVGVGAFLWGAVTKT